MYAILPDNARPSKSLSTDKTRPVLMAAELRETGDGWEIVTCDSYQLACVALEVREDDGEPLIAGPISGEALKAIEKSRAFRANGTIEPCALDGRSLGQSFAQPEVGAFPNWETVKPVAPDAIDA